MSNSPEGSNRATNSRILAPLLAAAVLAMPGCGTERPTATSTPEFDALVGSIAADCLKIVRTGTPITKKEASDIGGYDVASELGNPDGTVESCVCRTSVGGEKCIVNKAKVTVTDGKPNVEGKVDGDTEGSRYIYPTLNARSTTRTTVTTTRRTTTTEPFSTAEFGRNINDMSASSTQKTDQENPRIPDTKLTTNDSAYINHGHGGMDGTYITSRLQSETPLTYEAYTVAKGRVTTTIAGIRQAAAAARTQIERHASAHEEQERAMSNAGQVRGKSAYVPYQAPHRYGQHY